MDISELVSIIVPVYNAESNLQRCVDSLLKQDYSNTEIILINDGSTDKSGSICERFRDAYSNIIYIKKDNGGVSSARNTGLENAHGNYIVFADSDDYLELDCCSKLVSAIKSYDADIVFSGHYTVQKDKILDRHEMKSSGSYILSESAGIIVELFNTGIVNQPFGKIFKKDKITSLFKSHLSLGEDLVFVLEYLTNCESIAVIPGAYYAYVSDNENSLSKKYRQDGAKIALELYKYSVKITNKIWPKNEEITKIFEERLLKNIIAYAEVIIRTNTLKRKQKINKLIEINRIPEFRKICASEHVKLDSKQERYRAYLNKNKFSAFYSESLLRCRIKCAKAKILHA